MPRTVETLPPKLEAVLIRLGRRTQLNVTKAVKLPYLVDVVAQHLLGSALTEGTHQTWEKGVVTSEVWHYLNKCEESPVLHLEPVPFSEEKRIVVDGDGEYHLTPEEEALVDAVVDWFGSHSATELGRVTKLMNPSVSGWGSNLGASVMEDAYERLSDDYQGMAESASQITLEQLRQQSTPVEDIEDAIA